jgi:hypothetical protein
MTFFCLLRGLRKLAVGIADLASTRCADGVQPVLWQFTGYESVPGLGELTAADAAIDNADGRLGLADLRCKLWAGSSLTPVW